MQQPYLWNGMPAAAAPIAPDWNQWIQRLYQSELKLTQMTQQLANMQKQLDDIKNKPPLHIEYHFDQLKVNRLEGTLNVGLSSPQGMPDIESFEAPDPACWKVDSDQTDDLAPLIRGLQNEMSNYMKDNATNALIAMEQQFGITLDDNHRSRISDDVRKQLDERVHYYARTSPYPFKGTDEEKQRWKDSIKEKTLRDIQGAFSAYLSKQRQQNLQKGADHHDELLKS
ncbi:spore germination protein GerPC [Cohnella silvisoli]|uniref:Spore germination protein GerPC n=1 Tax=Cohnella silvisoli TaxID=2873699 RepID=A0ABV1KSU9_9BACL|nr:spore germination protein GerPC [Cohnella silvisoli]MCD9021373.1 spore germination protein GerPC [Cohnella silvisoli]